MSGIVPSFEEFYRWAQRTEEEFLGFEQALEFVKNDRIDHRRTKRITEPSKVAYKKMEKKHYQNVQNHQTKLANALCSLDGRSKP